jgi:hypothetical protein
VREIAGAFGPLILKAHSVENLLLQGPARRGSFSYNVTIRLRRRFAPKESLHHAGN